MMYLLMMSLVQSLGWLVASAKHGGEAAVDDATLLAPVGVLTRTLQGTTKEAQHSQGGNGQYLLSPGTKGLNNQCTRGAPNHQSAT
jgi:hypothetical protein